MENPSNLFAYNLIIIIVIIISKWVINCCCCCCCNNNNNKYKTYIAHTQCKYFHMRITDDRIKSISQLKAMCINKSVKKLS